MLFNSWQFAAFFLAVTVSFFILPQRSRIWWLLVASCYFYSVYIPKYLFVLFAIILIDYFAALLIAKEKGKKRKIYLAISILANIGVLVFFKYYNFVADNLNELSQILNWNYGLPLLTFALPLGLSFHTFQALSYTVDVYRGKQMPEKNLGIYALYVMYYPQLVAGPIERPGEMLPQFHANTYFNSRRVERGLVRMLGGFFKKIIIADRAAIIVDQVYGSATADGWSYLIATILFAFQVYGDFSGYSDIALGASEVMGFKLRENFDRPYIATSISNFWRRWHMSLSSWFRDYVYIPLGGNRVTTFLRYRNLVVVFLLSGLWHGAGWTYIVWGSLHGILLVLSDATNKLRTRFINNFSSFSVSKLRRYLQIILTFSLTTFTWIFFRATNISQAFHITKKIVADLLVTAQFNLQPLSTAVIFENKSRLIFIIFTIVSLLTVEAWGGISVRDKLEKLPRYVRYALFSVVLWVIIIFGASSSKQFIYFVF